MGIIQQHLGYNKCCASIITIHLLIIFITPNEALSSVQSLSEV